MLYSRFVGVTAGLGVPRTLTWNGSKRTAPDTPAGLARAAITNAATSATRYTHGPLNTSCAPPTPELQRTGESMPWSPACLVGVRVASRCHHLTNGLHSILVSQHGEIAHPFHSLVGIHLSYGLEIQLKLFQLVRGQWRNCLQFALHCR